MNKGAVDNGELEHYRFRGARAVVLMHEAELRRCLVVWWQAKALNVELPQIDDPDYATLEALLAHIFGAARGYMVWMCRQLLLPDPEIRPAPETSVIEREAESYLEHVLERWRLPLAGVPEARFDEVYTSNWGVPHCIEAMLEHALVHPMRHSFQLSELITASRSAAL